VVNPNSRVGYLADPSVVKKIQVANLDDALTTRTNRSIPDLQAIRYMKVKAVLEPTGLWVTPESLNIPGQKFTGTVAENRVEGEFEIEHPVYDGSGAPTFPPDYGGIETLQPYLEAGELIQSDDPVLIEKAEEIVSGASNSWEAAVLLSRWVAQNIDYAIPGGGNARNTYDTRSGECGSHSFLLAAFCRAVGIPARVVWGCMYIPNYGGAFGQHAWNEIYMGDAGWVPLDSTANENDFLDSGHIRVGEYGSMSTALNPVSMEILEYRVGDGASESGGENDRYQDYLGEFTFAAAGMTVTTQVQDGILAIDIPGKVVLGLNDPDDLGRWYAKLSDQVFAEFPRDDSGLVTALLLHEMVRMPKQSEAETVPEEVPEQYRSHLGVFHFPQVGADFTVIWEDGSLAVEDPLAQKTVHLNLPDDSGGWLDEFDKNTIRFEMDDAGSISAMLIDSATRFERN
jgi:transglutaminase-like putative cysteine protease